MAFEVRKISNYGAGHPVVARLKVQTHELLQWADLPKEGREAVTALYFDMADFVAAGDKASEVYPVSASPAFSVGKLDSDLGQRALGILRDRPQVALAALVLLASFLLSWVQVTGLSEAPAWSSTAVSLPGKVATMRAATADAIRAAGAYMANTATPPSPLGGLAPSSGPDPLASAKAGMEQAKSVLALSQIVVLIFLVPVGAAAILFFEYRQARQRRIELATGAVGLLCVGATLYAREAVAEYITKMAGTGAESFKQAFQLGLGGWLIAACCIGLLATGLGYLRKTPGLPG